MHVSWVGIVVAVAIIALLLTRCCGGAVAARHKRREAELAAARRLDPTDPGALATVGLDALDDLSKSMVVDVDNAVRTSDNELALAVEEFGDKDTCTVHRGGE